MIDRREWLTRVSLVLTAVLMRKIINPPPDVLLYGAQLEQEPPWQPHINTQGYLESAKTAEVFPNTYTVSWWAKKPGGKWQHFVHRYKLADMDGIDLLQDGVPQPIAEQVTEFWNDQETRDLK